jgi:MoaA/NifB/PqqE/SkfB family radical SAM enzyme
MPKIDRITFNFNKYCPVQCKFCYMPFEPEKSIGSLAGWKRVVERIQEFSPSLLSFAGGDPLVYRNFYELLRWLKKDSYVNLNTSGFFLRRELYREIRHKVDSLCLPIDETASMQSRLRYSPADFAKFSANLEFFCQQHGNITINTLLTRENRPHLAEIAELLVTRKLGVWNLYQFWPFDFIENKERFEMNDADFLAAIDELRVAYGDRIDLRGWRSAEREKGYFFVTQLGEVYTVHKDDPRRYAWLGSIFADDIYDRWREHNTDDECNLKFHQIVDREMPGPYTRVEG